MLHQFASALPCSSLEDVLTLAPSICRFGMPKQLIVNGEVAALACSDTQAGDYLAHVWGRFGRTDLSSCSDEDLMGLSRLSAKLSR